MDTTTRVSQCSTSFDVPLDEQIEAYVDEVWSDVKADIAALVAIPSIADEKLCEPGNPYGPAAHEALRAALEMCRRLGLEAHDCDGHIGYADLISSNPRQIATIAHVDVVPPGTGWTADPYTMRQREGYLIGRGVLDDKGPAVLSMYAAHFFAWQETEPPCTLRVILGSDEETQMLDVEWYLKHFDAPDFLFTPDAEFPVGCGEKGRMGGSFIADKPLSSRILRFEGGTVTNAVPSQAIMELEYDATDLPEQEGIEVGDLGAGVSRIVAHGIGGHASLPEGTMNAIGMLVEYALTNHVLSEEERPYFELLSHLFASTDGSHLGIDATDDLFDPLTCIGGTMTIEGNRYVQTIDVRYPKSTSVAHMQPVLEQLAEKYAARFEVTSDMVPFYIDPNSQEVRVMVDAYARYAPAGASVEPVTMGGGTYARHFPNAVSFGPEDGAPTPEWVGPMHGADEAVSEDLLKRALKTYIYALDGLMRL